MYLKLGSGQRCLLNKYIVDGSLVRMGEREVLQLIKVIPLGDRWMGTIELDGNRLKIGVDEGRFGNPDDTGFELSLSL